MAVKEHVHSILVHEGLQLLPHLVILFEGGVCGVQGVVVAGNDPARLPRVRRGTRLVRGLLTHVPSVCSPPGMSVAWQSWVCSSTRCTCCCRLHVSLVFSGRWPQVLGECFRL